MKKFESFKELGLPPFLEKSLAKMNFVSPTPVQAQAIPLALEGKDILATAQTGTGKTGAFSIPLLTWLSADHSKQALVLAPTRELAAQIFGVLREMCSGTKIKGVLIVGGESFHHQARDISRGVDYVIATPGRLNDHLLEETIDLSAVDIVVLDEVDRMLDMGFEPQVKQIMRHVSNDRQTLLFSATLPKEIMRLASSFLRDPVRVEVGNLSEPTRLVEEKTIETTSEKKTSVLLNELEKRAGRVLIFAKTQSRTEKLTKVLAQAGHQAVRLHGGCSQSQRKRALHEFKSGSTLIMVATDLAGRGIDVPDIEHVINYDTAANREDHIHRVGRTGRFGKKGSALTLRVLGEREFSPGPVGRRPGSSKPNDFRGKRRGPGPRSAQRGFSFSKRKSSDRFRSSSNEGSSRSSYSR